MNPNSDRRKLPWHWDNSWFNVLVIPDSNQSKEASQNSKWWIVVNPNSDRWKDKRWTPTLIVGNCQDIETRAVPMSWLTPTLIAGKIRNEPQLWSVKMAKILRQELFQYPGQPQPWLVESCAGRKLLWCQNMVHLNVVVNPNSDQWKGIRGEP